MSNPIKAVTKVFKKVVGGVLGLVSKKWAKFVWKVLPYAAAAAAVVFTGGAALGILPTFSAAVGGVVSGLGLSAGLTGALTGAITSAGFGAAIGGILGGKKGLKAGFVSGLLTGGVMGAVNPGAFGIVKDTLGNVTTTNALAHGGNAFGAAGKGALQVSINNGIGTVTPKSGMLPPGFVSGTPPQPSAGLLDAPPVTDFSGTPSAVDQGFGVAGSQQIAPATVAPSSSTITAQTAGAGTTTAGPVATTTPAAGGGGMLGMFEKNPMLFGSLLQSVGGALGGGGDSAEDERKEREKYAEFGYGGAYTGSADPFGLQGLNYAIPQPRYYYDEKTNTVVDRQQTGG